MENSNLYNEDLAPIPVEKRTWNKWNLAALWVGMAVCIPTYLLASYMIKSGLSWQASLIIIALANLVITIPMVLNGHAGVKYGISFPVFGRSSFGIKGVHIPSLMRALVACGWFGVQTWIGGLSIYSIFNVISGNEPSGFLSIGQFVCFGIFWFINIYFIWKGTESIKWLEDYSAPILILIGLILIYWGFQAAGSFTGTLDQGSQLQKGTAEIITKDERGLNVFIHPLRDKSGIIKADECKIFIPEKNGNFSETEWLPLNGEDLNKRIDFNGQCDPEKDFLIQLKTNGNENIISSKTIIKSKISDGGQLWEYILWFTAMVGFWATMSISISDITRLAKNQKDQIAGQFIGLPGTMIFYSFVGIFVTCAAIISFDKVLISEDAPWDPVSLVSMFDNPGAVIFAQFAMLIATLSTNIAANVIAPANAMANLFPEKISFKTGGIISGIIGIIICPWWLLNEISGILIFISGLLGPVLGILLCDYFLIRKKELVINDLYKSSGQYTYSNGYNLRAMGALFLGVFLAIIGKWVPALTVLYSLSWFTGFISSFVIYYFLSRKSS